MAEEKRLENAQISSTEFGTIRLDDEVVAQAALIAARSVEGVAPPPVASDSFIGSMTDGALGMLGKKPVTRGVRVDRRDNGYTIVINVRVCFGACIPDLANEIQRRVKRDVEQMTGARVRAVDVFVQGIDFNTTSEDVAQATLSGSKAAIHLEMED